MILRGRRIADGGDMLQIGNKLRETNYIWCPSEPVQKLEEVEGFTSDMTSLRPRASPSGEIQSEFGLKRTAREVTSATDTAPLPELTPEPVLPFMVSVATSTDDLFESQIDSALESDFEQNMKEWNIRGNNFYRENAEGRSRSASPYTEEKESKTVKQGQNFALDEEVRKLHTAYSFSREPLRETRVQPFTPEGHYRVRHGKLDVLAVICFSLLLRNQI